MYVGRLGRYICVIFVFVGNYPQVTLHLHLRNHRNYTFQVICNVWLLPCAVDMSVRMPPIKVGYADLPKAQRRRRRRRRWWRDLGDLEKVQGWDRKVGEVVQRFLWTLKCVYLLLPRGRYCRYCTYLSTVLRCNLRTPARHRFRLSLSPIPIHVPSMEGGSVSLPGYVLTYR